MVIYIYFHKLGVSNLLPFTVELRSVDLSVVPGRLLKGKTMRTHGFLNITCHFFLSSNKDPEDQIPKTSIFTTQT